MTYFILALEFFKIGLSDVGGNVIVNIKDSRVALGKDMANKILV